MLAFITPLVTRGVIDNTVRDRIELTLHVNCGGEPLRICLNGNCLRDIAGCRVEFENAQAAPPPPQGQEPGALQLLRSHGGRFLAGDITLSRREHTGNVLHNLLSIEFFVEARVRILLQTASFRFTVQRGSWQLTPDEEAVQRLMNREVLHEHVHYSVRNYRGATVALTGAGFPLCHWDTRLNQAEAYMSIIPTLHEKYRCEPGGYLSEAYVVDRTDILTEAAEEEDARGRGATRFRTHTWELIDFVEPEHADQVDEAMHHTLFAETSRMTDAINEHIIAPCTKAPPTPAQHSFLTLYSSTVSHILATLLLTMDAEYSAETAALRLENLQQRLQALTEALSGLQAPQQAPLQRALCHLRASLSAFSASFHRA